MPKKEYLQHVYLCKKEVTAEVSIVVDDRASEADIQKTINQAIFNDDIEWDYYGKYEIMEKLDERAIENL